MRRKTLLAFSVICITGCATVSPVSNPPYYPSNPSAVLLSHKGDLRATASASTGGETVTGAYALTSHFGVLANGSVALHKSDDPNGNQYSGEIGAGFFDTLTDSHLYSELYGGIGWGSGSSTFQIFEPGPDLETAWQITGNEQTRFAIAWMQGAMGYARNNFSAVILLRISEVDIYQDMKQEVVRGAGLGNYKSAPYDTTVSGTGTVWTFIPAFELRYGLGRLQLVVSLFMPLSGTNDPLPDPVSNGPRPVGSLGLCYKF
jgi:hypothetical protein